MRIIIVADAWYPQINGVVRTLDQTRLELEKKGYSVLMVTPNLFHTVPCPTYPEIRLAIRPGPKVGRLIEHFRPQAIHIATEGTLGMAARRYCLRTRRPFTTSLHTRFPEYVNLRSGIPVRWGYAWLRHFHRPAARTLVTTPSLKQELTGKGFTHLEVWGRAVDTTLFKPYTKVTLSGRGPIFMYTGRVAVEKNLEAFLKLHLPGTKYIVGDGPDLKKLKARYPDVHFTGYKTGAELARHYSAADVFVFPSLTDTFGLVILEAMACGLPVAAYPVQGPKYIIQQGITGYIDEDLREAALMALKLDRSQCRAFAVQMSWKENTERFLQWLSYTSDQTTGTANKSSKSSVEFT
ncbi:MAG TPA: glycosyltransferase family 1 protein [Acidiferrobacteraceae bacterium]|nr:glycosyltransferase family 1 protein [Acidiferrobacteraceae bacterium]